MTGIMLGVYHIISMCEMYLERVENFNVISVNLIPFRTPKIFREKNVSLGNIYRYYENRKIQ